MMRPTIVIITAIALPNLAHADCVADPPGGKTIFCLGFDPVTGAVDPTPDGLFDTRDGLDIEVDLIVENGPLIVDALRIPGTGNTVLVYGEIRAEQGTGILGGPDLAVNLGDDGSGGGGSIIAGNGIDVGRAPDLSVNARDGAAFTGRGTAIRGGDRGTVDAEGQFLVTGGYRAIDLGDDSSVRFEGGALGFTGAQIDTGGGSAIKLGESSSFSIAEGGAIIGRTSDDPLPGTGVDLGSGSFFSESFVAGIGSGGAGLRITGTTGTTSIDNGFTGVLEGTEYGVLVEGGDANPSVQNMLNFGIAGDISLGGGADSLTVADEMASTGTTDLGAGDDLLSLVSTVSASNTFGLFDGGAGFDTAFFDGFAGADLDLVLYTAGVLQFAFVDPAFPGAPSLFFDFTNFESYLIDGTSYDTAALGLRYGFDLAPIPLPASGWLLIAGLGGLALRRGAARPAAPARGACGPRSA